MFGKTSMPQCKRSYIYWLDRYTDYCLKILMRRFLLIAGLMCHQKKNIWLEFAPTVASHCCRKTGSRLLRFVAAYSSNQNKQAASGGVSEASKPKHEQTDVIGGSSPRPCSWPCVCSPIGSRCQKRWGAQLKETRSNGTEWGATPGMPVKSEDQHLDEVRPIRVEGHWVFWCVQRGHGC